MAEDITRRKAHHLELCIQEDVGFQRRSTLLSEVELIHNSLPELALEEIDVSTTVWGHRLQAPLLIAAMSGGTPEASAMNRDLASVAQELGLGMGLGSQRPLLVEGRETAGFFLRDVAPDILLLGNLGLIQARDLPVEVIQSLVEQVGANALCLHVNPAQELIQPGGDRDFRGGEEAISRLVRALPVPVVVKETGCGMSEALGRRLVQAGVQWVDVSGAGGTSWVGVETLRAQGITRAVGELLWDWGIPTAASLAQLSALPLQTIATGGIQHGLDMARALALGASMVGLARPFLLAHHRGGREGVKDFALSLITTLKTVMLLTGCRNLTELRHTPLVLGPSLWRWVPQDSPLRARVI